MKMNQTKSAVLGCALPFAYVAGGVQVNSTEQIQQAMSLTEEHTGTPTNWTDGWNESEPEWGEGTVLTEPQAVEYALRNNRELRAEVETVGKAQADLVQAGLLQNPVLTMA